MIDIICPKCNATKCIIFEPCMHDLITKGKGYTKCDSCGAKLIVYNGDEMIEVMLDENNSSD